MASSNHNVARTAATYVSTLGSISIAYEEHIETLTLQMKRLYSCVAEPETSIGNVEYPGGEPGGTHSIGCGFAFGAARVAN